MRHILWLSALVCSVALAQTHETTLSTLGIPMPANSVICNSLSTPAPAKTCIAGTGITINAGQISASSSGGTPPGGSNYATQFNNGGVFGGTGPGTSGQVLTSNGSSSAPTFQSAGGSGAVSSVTAGATALLTVSPTTGSVVTDIANMTAYTVIGNMTNATAAPTQGGMANLQAALVAVNELTVSASPATGPTSDYDPSGWGSTVAYLHLTPASGGSTLNGLTAGSSMQAVFIDNAESAGGADPIILANESGSDSTAANRFHSSGTMVIPAGGRVFCVYVSISRWSCQ